MFTIKFTSTFKKDYKLIKRQEKNLKKLETVIQKLAGLRTFA